MHNFGTEISEDFLWARLEPLLGYLPAEQRAKVRPYQKVDTVVTVSL